MIDAYELKEENEYLSKMLRDTEIEYDACTELYKELLHKYQWISVANKLPEKDGSYLIAMYHRLMVGGIYKTYTAKFVASFNAEYKEWTVMGEVCTTVTHWMNLPDFPEE